MPLKMRMLGVPRQRLSWDESVGSVRDSVSLMRLEGQAQLRAKPRFKALPLLAAGSGGAAALWSCQFRKEHSPCAASSWWAGGTGRRCLHGDRGCRVRMGAVWDRGVGGTPGLSVTVPGPTQTLAPFTLLVTALLAPILIVIPSLTSPVSRRA